MLRGKMRRRAAITVAALWLVFALCYFLNAFERVENVIYDKLYQRVSPVDSRIVIIGIDDRSIEQIGQWPWSREVMADVVDTLTDGGAAAIGIDVLFDTPGRDPAEDERLAEALSRSDVVVLPVSGLFKTRGAEHPRQASELVQPLEMFRATRYGHVNGLTTTSDGVVRRAMLDLRCDDGLSYHSLAYELYDLYSGGTADPSYVPVNNAGDYYITFTGRAGWYHPISFSDVYEGIVAPQYFKDKLVLIGLYAQGVAKDWQFTAIDGKWPTYGVEIHANLLQQLIEGNFIRSAPVWCGFGLFALFSLAASVLFIRQKPRAGLALLVALLAAHCGAIYLIARSGWVTGMVCAPVFILLAYVASLIWHYTQTRLNEIRVRGTFGKYMAPPVIEKILEEGEDGLKLGGQRRTVTILFVDIRGFTPLSESSPPEEIVQILNEYLDLAASCIHRFGGTLDKFIGDAAMAIWGAPYDMPDHAGAAVRAAVAMREESAVLEQKLLEKVGKSVRFGIGINTGDAVIGNIGASFRMDYTAIGDAVNTAARLESKASPGQILVSKATVDLAEDEGASFSPLGGMSVKGKSEEIEVFEVV